MKTLLLTSTLIATSLGFSAPSQAGNVHFVATDSRVETQVCLHTAANNVKALKTAIKKQNDVTSSHLINNLQCNDMSLVKFAYKYQADATFNYLNRRMDRSNKLTPTVSIKDVYANNQAPAKTIYVTAK